MQKCVKTVKKNGDMTYVASNFCFVLTCCQVILWHGASITGWAIALTCYISHGAKHSKMSDFDTSGSQNP